MEAEGSELERESSVNNNEPPLEEKIWSPFKFPVTVELISFGIFFADSFSDLVTTNFILMKTCEVHFHYNKSICFQSMIIKSDNATDIESTVQPYSSVILTGMTFLSTLLPAVMTLFLGPWSDYNGRKPVLIFAAVGYFFKYVLLGALSWIPDLDPRFILIATLPLAFTGGIVNFITAAYSYISDITHDNNRAFRISILESVIYSASIAGLLCASYVFKAGETYAYLITYGSCASFVLLVTVATCFFVPESIQSTQRGKGFLHVFELKLLKGMFHVCFKKREGYLRTVIFLVMISSVLTISVSAGEANVLFLYTRLRFGWKVKDFTFWASLSLGLSCLGILLGSLLLTKWLKLSDATLGLISYLLKAVTSFYVAFIPSSFPNMIYYSGLINIFGGLCGPASRSILSKSVPKEDLGKVFGLTGSSEAMFPLAFGPLYTFIYNLTLNTLPGAFLLVSGALFLVSSVFFIIIYFAQRATPQVEYDRMVNETENEANC